MDKVLDYDLLEKALAALRPMGLQWILNGAKGRKKQGFEAQLRLHFGGKDIDYAVEIKRNLRPAMLGAVLHQAAGELGNTLLVTDYITPPLADKLREQGIQFIDLAGNAYLNAPPLLVWVKGQRQRELPIAREAKGRAFQATGLQVVFALLCKPEAVNLPYREIAALANVAHGTVGWVMPDLIKLGYVVEINKKRRLVERIELLKQWVDAYTGRLRPKLILGRYDVENLDWTAKIDATKYDLLLGGEPAARKITGHIRPGTATFYGEKVTPKLLMDYRLRPDRNGNVEILKKFWAFTDSEPGVVPEILIYADLLATGDARCLEIAGEMYGAIINRLK